MIETVQVVCVHSSPGVGIIELPATLTASADCDAVNNLLNYTIEARHKKKGRRKKGSKKRGKRKPAASNAKRKT